MANSIVNQLLHRPVVTLKEMAVSNDGHLYAEVVKKLFDLEIEHEETFIDGTIETRNQGSKLAQWQAQAVAERLKACHPGLQVEIVIIKTVGDKILDVALSRIGDKDYLPRN